MENKLLYFLKSTPEYKEFKKKSRIRSIVALLILVVFWVININTTDFNSVDDISMLYFSILVIITILLLKFTYEAFLKQPKIVIEGTISDIKEKRRVANDNGIHRTIVTYEYLVCCDMNEYWGKCVYDYIKGRSQKHDIGEQVIFFSMSPGNNYIITKTENIY